MKKRMLPAAFAAALALTFTFTAQLPRPLVLDASAAADDSDDEKIDTVTDGDQVFLGTPHRAWWGTATQARWSSVKKAYRYQVRLYEDGEAVARVTVDGTSYDFVEYIKEGRTYYFEVRAVLRTYIQRYADSENEGWKMSADHEGVSQGEVDGHWRNYQEGTKYQKEDRSYASAGWLQILGKWYYFDADGYVKKNCWLDDKGSRYYLREDGAMAVGWLALDGSWYYMGPDGAMQIGWVNTSPGEWYYLNPDGRMAVSTVVDGCVLDENGLYRK